MKRTRTVAFFSVLLIGLFAFSSVAIARAPGGQRQSGDTAIGGLIDVVVNNTQALNNISVPRSSTTSKLSTSTTC